MTAGASQQVDYSREI